MFVVQVSAWLVQSEVVSRPLVVLPKVRRVFVVQLVFPVPEAWQAALLVR